jgi:hypothetical protein
VLADFHRAQNAEIEVTAAHHREALGAREVRRTGNRGHGFLARVDEIRDPCRIRWDTAPFPSRPFSVWKTTLHSIGNVVRDSGRDADAEVDVEAVTQLLGDPFSRYVLFSMRFS